MTTTITTEDVLRAARELAVEQYQAGETVASICNRMGFKRQTFTDMLKRLGVYEPGRKAAPAKQERCKRGHSMKEFGRPIKGTTQQYCSECKRLRERVKDIAKEATSGD